MNLSKYLTSGIIIGLVAVIYSAILYSIGIDAFSNFWLAMLNFPILIFLLFFFAVRFRNRDFKGFWNFREAFLCLFVLSVVSGIVTTLWNVLLFNVIDTHLAADMTERIMESTLEMMEKWGAPENDIDRTMDELASTPDRFSTGGLFLSFAKSLLWFALISAIGGLITRKSEKSAVTI